MSLQFSCILSLQTRALGKKTKKQRTHQDPASFCLKGKLEGNLGPPPPQKKKGNKGLHRGPVQESTNPPLKNIPEKDALIPNEGIYKMS